MTSLHMTFTVESQEGGRHVITLSQSETQVCRSIEDNHDGTYSCKSCARSFDCSMKATTHGLTNCGAPLADLKSISAFRICMFLDKSAATKLFHTYIQMEAEDTASETDEGDQSDDDDEEEEEEEEEEEKKAGPVASTARLLKYADFSVTPPASLSAEDRAEWTFKRGIAKGIRDLMNANLKDNGRDVNHDAVLTAWNSSMHPCRSGPNSKPAKPLKTYRTLREKEHQAKKALAKLKEKAEKTESAGRAGYNH